MQNLDSSYLKLQNSRYQPINKYLWKYCRRNNICSL